MSASGSDSQHGAKFRRLLYDALTSEDVLLYDATGKPIRRGSDLWIDSQAEWRRSAHQLLDSLLDRLPSDNLSTSPEELVQVFKTLSRANPKDDPPNGVQPKKNRLKFDVTDFKLSIELGTVTVAGKRVDVKASVPLAPLLGAVVGYS